MAIPPQKIATVITGTSGSGNTVISAPAYIDSFVVVAKIVGVLNNVIVRPVNNSLQITLGGRDGFKGNIVGGFSRNNGTKFVTGRNTISTFDINGVKTSTAFISMGTIDALGKPSYLEKDNDIISADMLKSINNSLPEGVDLTKNTKSSSYLNLNATTNIVLKAKTDVFVTFVSSVTSNKNSLGFYKYATSNPPKILDDIKEITMIFPNSKLSGSGNAGGGNLQSGNKVKLGTFGADTTIGFVLYQNGWNGNTKSPYVNTNNWAFFSDYYLNPETSLSLRKHSVLLNYRDSAADKNYFVVGFDDSKRDVWTDNDFNDCIYYVSTTDVQSVDLTNVKTTLGTVDSDNDGVDDNLDAYPNDANRAYNTFYPTISGWGTLAFEDNWPLQGDYDMNDLLVNYRYQLVSNAKNQLVEVYADFVPTASGATYNNGLGVQLPFSAASVKNVTGQKLNAGYVKLAANNTESGQTKAVIFPFDGAKSLINNPNGAVFVNTDPALPKVSSDTVRLKIEMATLVANVDPTTFNPFLVSNQRRGYEIHLPNYAPTDLVDKSLFGTNADASNAASGIYYVTKNNYPFALNFAESFQYPTETSAITDAFLKFGDWAASGGKTFMDWYKNTAAGYRNDKLIYSK